MSEGYSLIAPHLSLSLFSDVHVRLFPLHFVTFHFYLHTKLIKTVLHWFDLNFWHIPSGFVIKNVHKNSWMETHFMTAGFGTGRNTDVIQTAGNPLFPLPQDSNFPINGAEKLGLQQSGGMHYANDQISQTYTHSCEDSSSLKHQSEGLLNPTWNSLTGKYRGKKQ